MLDIRKFFDELDHAHLRRFLRHRVRDGVLLRLIGKWLNAGVLDEGPLSYPEAGSPQGGVVLPVLSNVLLHYVLDHWFAREVTRIWRKWPSRRRRAGSIPWLRFNRLLERHPLPSAVVVHSVYRRTVNPRAEEPYASIAHVRICGSPGRTTTQGHPAAYWLASRMPFFIS